MPNKLPLEGKTIYLTGTQIVQTIAPFVEQNGGKVKAFPLIQSQEIIGECDAEKLYQACTYDWLIFTSQNAVTAFIWKLERHQLTVSDFSCKMAAVGEKTAALLQTKGFTIDFMPTIYSADQFVEQFQLVKGERILFLRGSLAKPTIREGVGAEEWTVYETVSCLDYIREFKQSLIAEPEPIVIFASPPQFIHTRKKLFRISIGVL